MKRGFPNASCVVSLVDRLVHHAEVIAIEADSYCLKEAKEQADKRRKMRKAKTSKKTPSVACPPPLEIAMFFKDISDYWSSEQALAIVEFLDDLQNHIYDRYELQIRDLQLAERDSTEPDSFRNPCLCLPCYQNRLNLVSLLSGKLRVATSLPTSPSHIPRRHSWTQRAEADSMPRIIQHTGYRQAWRQPIT